LVGERKSLVVANTVVASVGTVVSMDGSGDGGGESGGNMDVNVVVGFASGEGEGDGEGEGRMRVLARTVVATAGVGDFVNSAMQTSSGGSTRSTVANDAPLADAAAGKEPSARRLDYSNAAPRAVASDSQGGSLPSRVGGGAFLKQIRLDLSGVQDETISPSSLLPPSSPSKTNELGAAGKRDFRFDMQKQRNFAAPNYATKTEHHHRVLDVIGRTDVIGRAGGDIVNNKVEYEGVVKIVSVGVVGRHLDGGVELYSGNKDASGRATISSAKSKRSSSHKRGDRDISNKEDERLMLDVDSSANETYSEVNSSATGLNPPERYVRYDHADQLLKIAHMFHYCGIGILGLFVLQVKLTLIQTWF